MANSTLPEHRGLLAGIAAYLMWGLFPVYWKFLGHVAAGEVLAWRIVFSAVFMGALMAATGQFGALKTALTTRSTQRALALATVLISVNWFVFIWAVANDRVVQASLGYYINPLVNVVLGAVILKEKLTPRQWTAVGLAALAVGVLATEGLPWVSVTLATTFAFYGLVRKRAAVSAMTGLTAETMLVTPIALGWLLLLPTPLGAMATAPLGTQTLLVLAGPVTAVPLLFFAVAARRLKLSTLGMLQYMAPSMQLAIAVWFYQEPFTRRTQIAFGLIWLAVAVFSWPRRRAAQAA